jgi:hypothetical protein
MHSVRKFHGEAIDGNAIDGNAFDVITPDTTAQILGASPLQVRVIDSWAWVVWVHVEGRRPRFVSFQAFTELFNRRKRGTAKGNKRHLQGCLFTQSRA